MTMIYAIVVGLIAGWLAGQVMRGGGYGIIVDILLGLVGGVIGGWVFGLLGITAVLASPFVPMLFMGEEYGETAPFLFREDFSNPLIIDGARAGRKADYAYGGIEPPDPHDRASFEASKLQ